MALSILDRLLIIYERSNLSVSRFAQIIGKDRRTLTSWIDKSVMKEPSQDVLERITQSFRYSERIWDKECDDEEFFTLLTQIPKSEIKDLLFILVFLHLRIVIKLLLFPTNLDILHTQHICVKCATN